ITGVRQLRTAESAHRNDREGNRRRDRGERGIDGCLGESSERRLDVSQLVESEHVARSNSQLFALRQPLQAPGALVDVVAPTHSGKRAVWPRGGGGQAAQLRLTEEWNKVGVPLESGDEDSTRAEQQAEAARYLGRLAKGRRQLRGALRPRGERAKAQQPEIGIGRFRQPLEQQRQQLLH